MRFGADVLWVSRIESLGEVMTCFGELLYLGQHFLIYVLVRTIHIYLIFAIRFAERPHNNSRMGLVARLVLRWLKISTPIPGLGEQESSRLS